MDKFEYAQEVFSDSLIYTTFRNKTKFNLIPYDDADLKRVFCIDSVYKHQLDAFQCIEKNKNLLLVSPTNSGKTISYLFPLYKKWLEDKNRKFIFIFPTISLVNAKYLEFKKIFPASEVVVYTGDVDVVQRRKIRFKSPSILIFTPELFHQSFVCSNKHWKNIYSKVYSIVLDEVHLYSGFFGANFSWILERFLRNCALYKVSPILISCSGTVQNVQFIKDNFYFDTKVKIVYGEEIRQADQLFGVSYVPQSLYIDEIVELSKNGSKTLIFGVSRRDVEELCFGLKAYCADKGIDKRIFVYRGGLEKSERTQIEKRLESGDYDIVVSTSALEVGLNIKDLDNVLIYGYPFSKESFFQRIGRAGRTNKESVVLCLLRHRKLDKYYIDNPEKLLDPFNKSDKRIAFDRNCDLVKNIQLWLMSLDYGITVYEDAYKKYKKEIDWLVETQILQDKLLSFEGKTPGPDLGIREFGRVLDIKLNYEVIGSIDVYNSLNFLYEGMSYIHQGVKYTIEKVLKSGVYLIPYNNTRMRRVPIVHSVEVCNFNKVVESLIADGFGARKNYAYVATAHVYIWNDVKDSFILNYDNVGVFCVEYLKMNLAFDQHLAVETLENFYDSVGLSFKRSIKFFMDKTKVVFYDTDASGLSIREFAKYYEEYFRRHPEYKLDKIAYIDGYANLKKFFRGSFKRAVFVKLLDVDALKDPAYQFEIVCFALGQSKTKKVTIKEFVEIAQNFRLLIGFFSEDVLSYLDDQFSSAVHYINMQSSIDVVNVSYDDLLYCYGLDDVAQSVKKIYDKCLDGYFPIKSQELSRIQCLWN